MELQVKNLTKYYGKTLALDHLSVTLTEGVYGILGPNGAGKSTWMNLLTDNIRRTEGEILLDGTDILKMGREYRSLVGYMPQQQGLYEQMSGRAFLYYMGGIKGLKRAAVKEQIEELLRIVNLAQDADEKMRNYSGGMKQRILLAQALLGDPKILILDEPTAGLDPKERIRVRNYIADLSKQRIVLLATHIVSDIESIADEVLLLKKGRLVAEGNPEALIAEMEEQGRTPLYGRMSLEDVYMAYIGTGEE